MGESRVKKIGRNVVFSVALKLSILLIHYFSRVIFVHYLNASYLGINGLFSGVLSILSLADLGMGTAMMYSLYKPLALGDRNTIIALIAYFRKIYRVIALLVTFIGLAITPFLRYIINLENTIDNIYVYYFIFLFNSVCTYLFVYRTVLLTADQKEYILSKYTIIMQIITFITKTVCIIITKNFMLYLLTESVLNIGTNIVLNSITIKHYPYLKCETSAKLSLKEKKDIFHNVKSLFLYKIGSVFQGSTDSILISIFVGTVIVGKYSNYTMIITNITGFVYILFNSIKASVGNLVAEEMTSDKSYGIFKLMEFINYMIITFCCVCFLCLFQDFTIVSYGKDYELGISVIICLVINFYTSNIRQSIWAYREATGLFNETKYITLVTTTINIVLSIVLGYCLGIVGVIVATIIARMVYAWWKEPSILFGKYFKKPVKEYLVTYSIRIVISTLICIAIYFVCSYIKINNLYVNLIIKMSVCIVLYIIIFFIIFHKHEQYICLKQVIKTHYTKHDR